MSQVQWLSVFLMLACYALRSTAICTTCDCREIVLNALVINDVLCADKPWLYLTDRNESLPNTTLFFTVTNTPLIELGDPETDFAGIPLGQLEHMTFKDTGISVIPTDYFSHPLFTNLTFLLLDRSKVNDLADVLSKVGQALNLNELSLVENPFSEITKEMFRVHQLNVRLESLDIGRNSFTLPTDLFDEFAGNLLTVLSLRGMPLGADVPHLERVLLPLVDQLQLLDLSDTELQVVPSLIGSMSNLIQLVLSNNAIKTLDKGTDSFIRCLLYTDSYSNSTFFFNPALEILMMSNNLLEVLDTRAFPESLTRLDLSANIISDIKYGFRKFTKMQELVLSSNQIKALLPDLSNPTDNPELAEIDLRNNYLSSISKEWLEVYEAIVPTFPQLSLRISFNPFNCLCGMAAMFEHIYAGDLLNHTDVEDINCYMPDDSIRNIYEEFNGAFNISTLTSVTNCSVASLCVDLGVNMIDCSNQLLPVVPDHFSGSPWFVDLSNNGIQSLTPSYLDGHAESAGIKELNLSYNLVPFLSVADVANLSQLVYLNLSYNRIQFIEPHTFINNRALETLDLSYNYITTICHEYGAMGGSLWYPLALPTTTLDLSHNQIGGLPCNAFSFHLEQDPSLPFTVPDNITWHSLDLSYNCIYLNGRNATDFYQPATANYSGNGVRTISGLLDLSHNFIGNASFLFEEELSALSCVGRLNLEHNLIEFIDNSTIYGELVPKWETCGSSLLLGNNPYDCGCPAIDFWTYHNQTDSADLLYLDFTSRMECALPVEFFSLLMYELGYPHCACQNGSNPCFIYSDPSYYSECAEVVFSQPPQAECSPCPAGFVGDGVNCTVVDPCVSNPCFIDANDPSLNSTCNQTGPGSFTCGSCPQGFTGSGHTALGCLDLDMCQVYSCYSDSYIALNCTDEPPPSLLIACGPCPTGLVSVYNSTECLVEGQCCQDEDPCADNSTNSCFLPDTCINQVWPDTGVGCASCPLGTEDLSPLISPGIDCVEIDGCEMGQCYNDSSTPAICTDVPWDRITVDAFEVECTCAAGTTGSGVGEIGCTEIDGCRLDPCWEDLAGLGVKAICDDVLAYPGMVDPLEVNCTCPEGTVGDGLATCVDTDPCANNNPCFVDGSCSVPLPPLDTIVCGPCPQGYQGDGRNCVDIDECSESNMDPTCHAPLACVPTPAPHDGGLYSCQGECPCGMVKVSGGKGSQGCEALDMCINNNPCSLESSCNFDITKDPSITCGACSPGHLPIDDCLSPGTKACCVSSRHLSFRLNAHGVAASLNHGAVPVAGILQVYYNERWGDVVYNNIDDVERKSRLLSYTADAVCRYLGFPVGHALPAELIVANETTDSFLDLLCARAGQDVMRCDHSAFYSNSSACTAPDNRHYVICSYGITGYHLYGSVLPSDGQVYVSFHPVADNSSCATDVLAVCYNPGVEMLHTATDICLSLGFSGMYSELTAVTSPLLNPPPAYGNVTCAVVENKRVMVLDSLPSLHIRCHEKAPSYRLIGRENYLQMRIGYHSFNGDQLYWGYLSAAHYMNLSPGYRTNTDWDTICQSMGYHHMVTIDSEVARDRSNNQCRSWHHWDYLGHQLNQSCDGGMITLKCSSAPLQVRVVDVMHQPSSRGRVDIRMGGVWSTLTVQDGSQVTSNLASAACVSAGYLSADWWLTDNLTTSQITNLFGTSRNRARTQLLIGDNFLCEAGGLLECANQWPARLGVAHIREDFYGRMVGIPQNSGYTLVVQCTHDAVLMELTKGHYGDVIVFSNPLWLPICVNFDPICANYTLGGVEVPDSRLADAICWNLGYVYGHAISLDDKFEIELPSVVYGPRCHREGHCERYVRACNLTGGENLLAVRCLDPYDACSPETNICFWKESCVDLLQGQQRVCRCPPGYEGNGVDCTDIDECSDELNPCFLPTSCVPVPAPETLGDLQVDGVLCAPCPQGTVDVEVGRPGRICLEVNGCIPNRCSNESQCIDVERSADDEPGYVCGACGAGYLPASTEECLSGALVSGSVDCCVDGDACASQPCGDNKQCFDLPPPASVVSGYVCGDCPIGTNVNLVNGKCQDINYCGPPLSACDEHAFCEDLPAPTLGASCRCHSGYLQNTPGIRGACQEVNICESEPGVCGTGRNCVDLAPPNNPYMFDVPAAMCSECFSGYLPSSGFSFTLVEYELANQMNKSLTRDCVDYDACAAHPDACYKFPGNAAYDSECIDTPAAEDTANGISYRCGPCILGMTGSGYGPTGCENIDSCASNPCSGLAEECIDLPPPNHGFTCHCLPGTTGVGMGNSQCIDIDACQVGHGCVFPGQCVDLPYNADHYYECVCPLGMYHVTDWACAEIDGCLSRPCYGGCTDVKYTDIVLSPGSNGTDVVCDPCPHGTQGNAVGVDGCEEINLCDSFPYSSLLCYNELSLGLSARCVDVPFEELLPTDPADMYRCQCPDGMQGDGLGYNGCANVDYCQQGVCPNNTICIDYPPPSTAYTCICAAGYTPVGEECVELDACTKEVCDVGVTCLDLPPPMDPYSTVYPVAECVRCPLGTRGANHTVYIRQGVIDHRVSCEEIDGCEHNDTCWVNPYTGESLCEDVPSSQLDPRYNSGYEVQCKSCPFGLENFGKDSAIQRCIDIDGCKDNRCFIGVECVDVSWRDLQSTQPADDYLCADCPQGLQGDGRTCTGGCDFDLDLCSGEIMGWIRTTGLLNDKTLLNINLDPLPGQAPMYDRTQPFTTKGYFLGIDGSSPLVSTFYLPRIGGPAAVRILFHFYYNGPTSGTLSIRQIPRVGNTDVIWNAQVVSGTRWIGVQNVHTFGRDDFMVAFEFSQSSRVHSDGFIKPYVAIDDLFIEVMDDWGCTKSQLCSPKGLCMSYPEGHRGDNGEDYVCLCQPGYTDRFCATKIDYCIGNPCPGYSTCVSHSAGYTCLCPPTFTGDHCGDDVDECSAGSRCANGGTCLNISPGYRCLCAQDFTGDNCLASIDDCLGVDCGHGKCFDHIDHYTCVCDDSWTGPSCKVKEDTCTPNPCLNAGICNNDLGPFTCNCAPGFRGTTCDENVDECASVVCLNNGICEDLVDGYSCFCTPGYEGTLCELEVRRCNSDTCSGNGVCHEGIDDLRCLCTQPNCRDSIDCSVKKGRFVCECDRDYTGDHCDRQYDYCFSNPCNHGTCEGFFGGFKCRCSPGWKGYTCNEKVDMCATLPCKNTGKCINLIGSYRCQCELGFTNENCSENINDCDSTKCMNGGRCIDEINGFTCLCPPQYTGPYCSMSVSGASLVASMAALQGPQELSASSSSPDACGWSSLDNDLRLQIIGYTSLALVLLLLALLVLSLCRIKVSTSATVEYSKACQKMDSRYVQHFPVYRSPYRYFSPQLLASTRQRNQDAPRPRPLQNVKDKCRGRLNLHDMDHHESFLY